MHRIVSLSQARIELTRQTVRIFSCSSGDRIRGGCPAALISALEFPGHLAQHSMRPIVPHPSLGTHTSERIVRPWNMLWDASFGGEGIPRMQRARELIVREWIVDALCQSIAFRMEVLWCPDAGSYLEDSNFCYPTWVDREWSCEFSESKTPAVKGAFVVAVSYFLTPKEECQKIALVSRTMWRRTTGLEALLPAEEGAPDTEPGCCRWVNLVDIEDKCPHTYYRSGTRAWTVGFRLGTKSFDKERLIQTWRRGRSGEKCAVMRANLPWRFSRTQVWGGI